MAFGKRPGLDFGIFGGLSAPAVLHTNVAGGAHMEPGLKAILEGHRGDIEVIAQALKAEVAHFFHGINLEVFWVIHRWRLLLTLIKGNKCLH
jgi:hypothetical protein